MRSLLTVLAGGVLAVSGAGIARAQSRAPDVVRVAAIAVANYAPLAVAKEKGFFTDENLSVTTTMMAQGGIVVQAIYGGSAEIGGTAIFEPMVARGNGLDIMFVSGNARIRSAPPDNNAVLVRADDVVKDVQDLRGKRVSAGLLNSINHVHMLEWLNRHGVDPASVRFLEVPFPQMGDALLQKALDAVWNVEPFVTPLMATGKMKVLGYPYQENIPGMDVTGYIAKESWLKAHADVALRMKKALDRATNYINNASKEERDGFVAKYSGMNPEIVAKINLPVFVRDFNVPSLRANLDLALKYKMVAKSFDVDTMIWKP